MTLILKVRMNHKLQMLQEERKQLKARELKLQQRMVRDIIEKADVVRICFTVDFLRYLGCGFLGLHYVPYSRIVSSQRRGFSSSFP